MKIIVCPLSKVQQMVRSHLPESVVSVLDPGFEFPQLGPLYQDRHLRLCFHDAHDSSSGQIAPAATHINQLLQFLSRWTRSAPILIHCRAGIGRSTAAGFIAARLHNPEVPEMDVARSLRNGSPLARPNELLIQLADIAMGRGGRMLDAIRETGRNLTWEHVDENTPFELLVPTRNGEAPLLAAQRRR